ncbi:MAG: hypothetical protein K2H29_09140 [Oscillospiraceae bacterium]|nr:hypothetical protein [Oscillospiraceae bacterium]MDE5885220.1 hypothetical protein [Oscillospiraceae bacterium]
MKKFAVSAGILSACLLCSAGISAKAYTADDVAQKAREAGWPEYLIQSGYNEWASGSYTQEDLNDAYDSVESYNEQTEEMICNAFGIEPQPKPVPAPDSSPDSEPDSENSSQPDHSGNSDTPGNPGNSDNSGNSNIPDRIPSSDFINMTLDEKKDYVNSLPEDQKSEFLSSLTKEERNSIIKQFPTEQKVALMQTYIDTASSMGMNVVVDSMTDQNISVTVRNDEGVIIDKAGVGVVIDETGISHTKPLVFAGLGILTAAAGFVLLYWYSRKTEEQ